MPPGRRVRRRWLVCAALCAGALGLPAGAEEATAPPGPPVELERLLKLPRSLEVEANLRGGATRGEWRERFEQADRELADAEAELAKARAELEELASESDSWQIAAPGAAPVSSENTTISYSLRQRMRTGREDVERARRALSELEIEANLAGVPEDWRRDPDQTASGD